MTSVLLKLSLLLSFCMPTNSAVSFEKNVANMAVAESTILTCSPTAICVNGVTISLPDGSNPSVTINAADLDFASYSDCPGAGALSFSFDANSPLTQQTFNCTQLGFPTLNLWVTDIAGNQSSCETFIIVQDNQASCSGGGGGNLPTPICVNGMVVSLPDTNNPLVTIDADDLNIGSYSDNPSAGALSFSFDAAGSVTQQSFDCAQLGQNTIELYVRDQLGNTNFCSTYISVQDNQASCPGGGAGNLPTPICVNGIVATLPNTNNPMVTINATDLDFGSYNDNPSAGMLSFSFEFF